MADIGRALEFKAGPGALAEVRANGFDPSRIGTMAGASGGPKWLVLRQLDRVILEDVVPRMAGPVHLIGSSIGAWRFACYAQVDPVAAIDRFEHAYLEQRYSEKPDRAEITAKVREILDTVMLDTGVGEILDHPVLRLHVMTVRARHVTAAEHPVVLGAGLLAAATLNVASRRSLGAFFERALFHDERDRPPFFEPAGFPLKRVPLTRENLKDAVVASGSIPLVIEGVRDIAGAPRGVYRDGGIIDYHLDIPHSEPDRLTLYPHFYGHIVPGWFDKKLAWRVPNPLNVDRTIVISPSPEFVDTLPNRKIPDRSDFENFPPEQRRRDWRAVIVACRQLADELHDVLDRDQLAARLEPL